MTPRSEFERAVRGLGWTVELTGSNHLRCRHPDLPGRTIFAPCTPGNDRGYKKKFATIRRLSATLTASTEASAKRSLKG